MPKKSTLNFHQFSSRCEELSYKGFYNELIVESNLASSTMLQLYILCNALGVKINAFPEGTRTATVCRPDYISR